MSKANTYINLREGAFPSGGTGATGEFICPTPEGCILGWINTTPTNGTSGTGAGVAAPGCTLVNTAGTSGANSRFKNNGTLASPTWDADVSAPGGSGSGGLGIAGPSAAYLQAGDNQAVVFGDATGGDALILFSTGDADNNALVIAVDDSSQALHITDKGARATDWNIAATTHPNVYVHSNTTPATDYLRLGGHDGTTADIDVVGGTTLRLMAAGTAMTTLTATALTMADGQNIVCGSTTGTKIGTATTQKLGFFNKTPVVQLAKASYSNWGALSNVVQALVDIGLFDAA